MKYPVYLLSDPHTKITTLYKGKPEVGDVIQVGPKSYVLQGLTGGSHGVGYGGPNGELPSIDSVSWYAKEIS